jgi:hypothetical protein
VITLPLWNTFSPSIIIIISFFQHASIIISLYATERIATRTKRRAHQPFALNEAGGAGIGRKVSYQSL